MFIGYRCLIIANNNVILTFTCIFSYFILKDSFRMASDLWC